MTSRFGLAIRAADAGDAAGLVDLLKRGSAVEDARAIASRLENMRADDAVVLVAVEWGPPSGVIAASWNRTLNADLPTAFVTTLMVDPEARRRGVARLLLKALSQAARAAGCGELMIVAGAGLTTMREFCRATGFVEGGNLFTRSLRKGR